MGIKIIFSFVLRLKSSTLVRIPTKTGLGHKTQNNETTNFRLHRRGADHGVHGLTVILHNVPVSGLLPGGRFGWTKDAANNLKTRENLPVKVFLSEKMG